MCFKFHTQGNQTPIWLLCTDGGLPKPELISRIEQGRELFRDFGEPQKSGDVIFNPADLHVDPVIEGQQFWSKYKEIRALSLTMSHSSFLLLITSDLVLFGWAEAWHLGSGACVWILPFLSDLEQVIQPLSISFPNYNMKLIKVRTL